MRWIKYNVLQGTVNGENIVTCKKVGYSEANLAIAEKEAYNGYKVVEDTKSFVDSLKAQSILGITGNNNLLINSNFTNPVNLRKELSKTSRGRWLDGWVKSEEERSEYSVIKDSCICISGGVRNISKGFYQIVKKEIVGKTITVSLCIKKNVGLDNEYEEILSTVGKVGEYSNLKSNNEMNIISKYFGNLLLSVCKPSYSDFLKVMLSVYTSSSNDKFYIKWIKLEIGEEVTPYVARSYEEELSLCCAEPLVIEADLSTKLEITDVVFGDEVLDAVLRKREILVHTPNADGKTYTKVFSPIYKYQLPNEENDYLYLYYLRDEMQVIDLSAAGLGVVQMPIYGEVQLKLSKEYKACPLRDY